MLAKLQKKIGGDFIKGSLGNQYIIFAYSVCLYNVNMCVIFYIIYHFQDTSTCVAPLILCRKVDWAGIIWPTLLMTKLEHRELKGVAQGRARTVAATLRQSPVFLIPNSVIFPLSPCPQCLPYWQKSYGLVCWSLVMSKVAACKKYQTSQSWLLQVHRQQGAHQRGYLS